MKTAEDRVVLSGEFTLDRARRCIWRQGERLHVTPRVYETLACLVEHHDETVTKQQLTDAVWKDVAVTDASLTQAIREARRLLQDDDKNPRFIQTVPRVGYRFIASVSPLSEPASTLPGPTGPPTRPILLRPSAWAVGLVAAFLSLAVWLLYSKDDPPLQRGVSEAVWTGHDLRQLTLEESGGSKPQYSPDGRSLLFVSYNSTFDGLDLFSIPAHGGERRQLTNGTRATGDTPSFTPDGSHVVFSRIRSGDDGTRLRDLWEVPAAGGLPTLLLPEASGAGFSPDGTEIAYTKYVAGRKALWVGAFGTPESHREMAPRGFFPRWSPDGRWIAFTTSDPEGGSGHLWLAGRTGEPVRLTAEAEDMYGLAWAHDSQAVFVASDRNGQGVHLRRIPISGGPAIQVTAGVGHYMGPTVSPDGRTIAFTYIRPSAKLVVAESLTDAKRRPLSSDGHRGHLWPRFSPSGRLVASIVRRDEGERLWVTDVKTGNRVSASDRLAAEPAWLDEHRVAYFSSRDETTTTAYLLDVESGRSTPWFEVGSKASWIAAHPDGHTVAYVVRRATSQEIEVRDLRGGSTRVAAAGGQYEALRWRPDGSALAWSGPAESANVASNGIWLLDAESDTPRQVVKDGYSPVWRSDGQAVYFARVRGNAAEVGLWQYDLARGDVTKIRQGYNLDFVYYDIAGSQLVFSSNASSTQIFEMRLSP